MPRDTVRLARYLLGKVLVRETDSAIFLARIVETEGYLPGDAACHAYRGITRRNRSLFLRKGHAYVYICYGIHTMLNVSSEAAGIGAGVLIRALQPLGSTAKFNATQRGPGRLTAALKIDMVLDGIDLLVRGPLWLGSDGYRATTIGNSLRIGITKAADLPLRFFIADNPYVSGPRERR